MTVIENDFAVFFTGHRPIELWGGYPPFSTPNHRYEAHKTLVLEAIDSCIRAGYHTFISGGAQGMDLLAALCVHEKRAQYPHIKLIIARPFPSQHSTKPEQSQAYIRSIEFCADSVIDVSPDPYSPAKMQIRNKWMVDNASIGIALYNGRPKGGTYNCITYAKSQGKWMLVVDSDRCVYYVMHV